MSITSQSGLCSIFIFVPAIFTYAFVYSSQYVKLIKLTEHEMPSRFYLSWFIQLKVSSQ